jgi:hypothetical protein
VANALAKIREGGMPREAATLAGRELTWAVADILIHRGRPAGADPGCPGRRSTEPSCAEQAPDVGGLACVLEAIVGDAYQLHTEGDRRVAATVHKICSSVLEDLRVG